MTIIKSKKSFIAAILINLILMMRIGSALANDTDPVWELPGTWIYSADTEEGKSDLAVLHLENDGSMSLLCGNEKYAYSYEGTWAIEIIDELLTEHGYNDRLRLHFNATDNPLYAGNEYNRQCIYYVYAETWVEDSTRYTYLINSGSDCDGISPFEELCREEGTAVLHKEEGPNMQVINCKKNVSLREKRSKKSACLAKVPLGALVFAFPEENVQDGFIRCVYGSQYGFILQEYLQPIKK